MPCSTIPRLTASAMWLVLAVSLVACAAELNDGRTPALATHQSGSSAEQTSGTPIPTAAGQPFMREMNGDCPTRLEHQLAAADAMARSVGEDSRLAMLTVEPVTGTPRPHKASVVMDGIVLSNVHDIRQAGTATCVIVVGVPQITSGPTRRDLGMEFVPSDYLADIVVERNPAYDGARERLRQARNQPRSYSRGSWIRTGDPLFDLMGTVIQGVVGKLGDDPSDEIDAALADVESTPQQVEREIYKSYILERRTVESTRRATIPIMLVDASRSQYWNTAVHLIEERSFSLLKDLHPQDRSLRQRLAQSVTEDELDRWEAQAPSLEIKVAIGALVDTTHETSPSTGDISTMMASLGATTQTAPPALAKAPANARIVKAEINGVPVLPDRRLASVVGILSNERSGSGFYVGAERILTSRQLVGDSLVVNVMSADGTIMPGLIERDDLARDLALIKVPRTGTALQLDEGNVTSGTHVVSAYRSGARDAGVINGRIGREVSGENSMGPGHFVLEASSGLTDNGQGGPVLRGDMVIGIVVRPADDGVPGRMVDRRQLVRFLAGS